MTLDQAYGLGALRLTLPTWPPGQYLELAMIGQFRSPVARLRSAMLEAENLPPDVTRWDPRTSNVLLYRLDPTDAWQEYTGPRAPELEDA